MMALVYHLFPMLLKQPQQMPNTTITFSPFIAHRGTHLEVPENTLAAFQLAKARGATWIECDIQLTADNIPVIFHDFTLERLTALTGKVIETDFITLATTPLTAAHTGISNSSFFIPSFYDALACFASLKLCAHLEIKTDPKYADRTAEIFAKTLKQFPYFTPSNTIISGSDLNALAAAHQYLPEFKYGWVVDEVITAATLSHLPVPLFSIHMNYHYLTEKLVHDLIAKGYHVLAYTVNDAAIAQQLFQWGVNSVFTDKLV